MIGCIFKKAPASNAERGAKICALRLSSTDHLPGQIRQLPLVADAAREFNHRRDKPRIVVMYGEVDQMGFALKAHMNASVESVWLSTKGDFIAQASSH